MIPRCENCGEPTDPARLRLASDEVGLVAVCLECKAEAYPDSQQPFVCQLCLTEWDSLLASGAERICVDCARERAAVGVCPQCADTGEWDDGERMRVCGCKGLPCLSSGH